MPIRIAFLLLAAGWMGLTLGLSAAILHVKTDGDDTGSGATWELAKRSVTNAVAAASPGDEIWVASGLYLEHVVIDRPLALYGGFRGNESAREGRDAGGPPTILDGTANGIVVRIQGGGSARILEGFTIRNGSGAGVLCVDTSFVIRSNVIRANLYSASAQYGGGVAVRDIPTNVTALIEHNLILDNYSLDGGGIACIDASPRIIGNTLLWNLAAQNGGGISCWRNSSPLITHNVILGNSASMADGGMPVPVGGGGIFATADDLDGRPHPTATSSPAILNNLIAANGARKGGGIALIDANLGVPLVMNNTLAANNGAGLHWGSSALVPIAPVIRNNLVAFNPVGLEQAAGTPTNAVIESNCVHGNSVNGQPADYRGLPSFAGRSGNLSADPLLANPAFMEFHLQPGSPCVDAGGVAPDLSGSTDLDGEGRVLGNGIDIGADESDGAWHGGPAPVWRVGPGGDDTNDGRTWDRALRTVQRAIDLAKWAGGEVWVAEGTYAEHPLLPAFVHVYGGFAGDETERAARNPEVHRTLLDGAGIPNVVTVRNAGYRVSRLDGFTIENGGRFTGGAVTNNAGTGAAGGGIHIAVSSPFVANNRVRRNSLLYDHLPPPYGRISQGAGVYCVLSYAAFTGNTFEDNENLNTFDGGGGGLYCAESSLWVEANTFARNHAMQGSAIYALNSFPTILGNHIESNAMYDTSPLPLYLGSSAGAVCLVACGDFRIEANTILSNTAALGAGVQLEGCQAGRLQNNLIQGNRASGSQTAGGMGAGVYCLVLTNATEPIALVNNTLVGNVASNLFGELGGGIAFQLPAGADRLVIANNLIASNSSGLYQAPTPLPPEGHATLARNLLFNARSNYINLEPAGDDLSLEPRLVDPAGGDCRLAPDSPCIDAGTALFAPLSDHTGIGRPLDGDHDGQSAPDIGAAEYVHALSDSDADGMPDAWEIAHALLPTLDDSGADPDGDGATNYAECLAGTDPSEASSVLRLNAVAMASSAELRLDWTGLAGRLYDLEFRSSLAAGEPWLPLTNAVKGAGVTLQVTDRPGGGAARYYRLQVRPE